MLYLPIYAGSLIILVTFIIWQKQPFENNQRWHFMLYFQEIQINIAGPDLNSDSIVKKNSKNSISK